MPKSWCLHLGQPYHGTYGPCRATTAHRCELNIVRKAYPAGNCQNCQHWEPSDATQLEDDYQESSSKLHNE